MQAIAAYTCKQSRTYILDSLSNDKDREATVLWLGTWMLERSTNGPYGNNSSNPKHGAVEEWLSTNINPMRTFAELSRHDKVALAFRHLDRDCSGDAQRAGMDLESKEKKEQTHRVSILACTAAAATLVPNSRSSFFSRHLKVLGTDEDVEKYAHIKVSILHGHDGIAQHAFENLYHYVFIITATLKHPEF
eukprot:1142642-Pelagomonas_calceolata.AAC.15